jgi:hypothetical protein
VPRLANGKPDLSGHWANPYTPNMALRAVDPKTRQPLKFARQGEALPDAVAPASGGQARTYDLPYTEWGLKQWKTYDPVNKGDYAGNCLPSASRNMNAPHSTQTSKSDALFEQNTYTTGCRWRPIQGGRRSMEWRLDGAGRRYPSDETAASTGYQARHERSSTQQGTEDDQHLPAHRLEPSSTPSIPDPKTYTRDW